MKGGERERARMCVCERERERERDKTYATEREIICTIQRDRDIEIVVYT